MGAESKYIQIYRGSAKSNRATTHQIHFPHLTCYARSRTGVSHITRFSWSPNGLGRGSRVKKGPVPP